MSTATTSPNKSASSSNATGTTLINGSVFGSTQTATAASAHEMLKSFLVLMIFVIIATTVAGISDQWADGVLGLMLVFIVLQGLTHGAALASFSQRLTLTPKEGTS